jgi:Zn-finger nucleic acid-binding protein
MDHITYEGVPVQNCGSCGGYWLPLSGLRMILARGKTAMPEPVQQKMLDLAQASDTSEELRCPSCERPMHKKLLEPKVGPRLDYCARCAGVWVDRAELEACQIRWKQAHARAEFDQGHGSRAQHATKEVTPQRRGNGAARGALPASGDSPVVRARGKPQDQPVAYSESLSGLDAEIDAAGVVIQPGHVGLVHRAMRRLRTLVILILLVVAAFAAYTYLCNRQHNRAYAEVLAAIRSLPEFTDHGDLLLSLAEQADQEADVAARYSPARQEYDRSYFDKRVYLKAFFGAMTYQVGTIRGDKVLAAALHRLHDRLTSER